MRNIGKSTGQLEWWAPPFFFTSASPDTRAQPKNASARETATRRTSPRRINHTRLGTDSGGILMSFRTYNTHKSPRAKREVFLY